MSDSEMKIRYIFFVNHGHYFLPAKREKWNKVLISILFKQLALICVSANCKTRHIAKCITLVWGKKK